MIVTGVDHRLRDAPEVDETPVGQDDFPLEIHCQNAIGGRAEYALQLAAAFEQRRFHLPALGDVLQGTDAAQSLALRGKLDFSALMHPFDFAADDYAMFAIERRAVLHEALPGRGHRHAVDFMHTFHVFRIAARRFLGHAEDATAFAGHFGAIIRQVVDPAANARHGLRTVQIMFARLQLRADRAHLFQPAAIAFDHMANHDRGNHDYHCLCNPAHQWRRQCRRR